MAANLESVVKQLTDSGIIAPGKLEAFIPPKADPKTVEELVQALVKSENLTAFQGTQVKAGKAKALILGNYTILDKIGAGGMGQVFKAQHRRMKRIVAIKMLPSAMTKDAAALARFEREVEAAARLSHSNIVAAYDADEANGAHFLVMEYVEGKDLSATVKKSGPFPVNKALNYILQAARGLEFAHGEGVVHRDIKPANLLLDRKGVIKILDMGLARLDASVGGQAGPQAELTGTGTIMGTVDYMSPEQAFNTKNADARADIYSLGCTLYYLITGKAVYAGDSVMEKLLAHRELPVPPLRTVEGAVLAETVPDELGAVFQKMMAKKVEDRYQAMTEVVADLEKCQAAFSGVGSGSTLTRQSSGPTVTQADLSIAFQHTPLALIPSGFVDPPPERPKKRRTAAKQGPPPRWKNRKLLIGAGAAACLLLVLLCAVIVIKMQTKDGTLVIEVNQPDAIVQVLDSEGKVEISQPGGLEAVSISVVPGKHRLRVEKDGFVAIADDIEVVSGGTLDIKARLVKAKQVAAAGTLLPPGEGFGASSQPSGGRRPDEGARPWNTPAFQQWMKTTQSMPAEKQIEAVTKKLMELNPGFDGKVVGIDGKGPPRIAEGVVTEIAFLTDNVADISPVRALAGVKALSCWGSGVGKGKLSDLRPLQGMSLTNFACPSTDVFDLWPLQGMPLDKLQCHYTQVSDLSPLKAMPLTFLNCGSTPVSDLSPLKGLKLSYLVCGGSTHLSDLLPLRGMPLTTLYCGSSQVADLSPLRAMPLTDLFCSVSQVADLSPLQDCTSLKKVVATKTKVTAAQVAALQKALPNCKIEWDASARLAYLDPAFQQWVTATQALPAEQQIEAVSKKLMELNPGFDGRLEGPSGGGIPRVENGVVMALWLNTDELTDLSPLRALAGLKRLTCGRTQHSKLADLSPLRGLSLEQFTCAHNNVSDLSPLEGMPLTELGFSGTKVADLSPIRGMPLVYLNFQVSPVADLSPVRGMRLSSLNCGGSNVSDLSPIAGMPLVTLITVKPQKITKGIEDLRRMTSLRTIGFDGNNMWPAAEFWKKYDAGEFGKPDPSPQPSPAREEGAKKKLAYLDPAFQAWVKATQALPAEQQIEAVSKKLMELNPGFDGKSSGIHHSLTPKIENGVVTEFGFVTDKATDISPVRALTGLRVLKCVGSSSDMGKLSDLSPLAGMPLTGLWFGNTQVSDLSPLAGMSLASIAFTPKNITKGLEVIRQMNSLKAIGLRGDRDKFSPAEFWKKYDAGEFGKPAVANHPWNTPAFQQWVKATQALPAEQQLEAVSKKLMELNPGFDGKLIAPLGGDLSKPKIRNGVVTELALRSKELADLSPVRALVGLRTLRTNCSSLVDLSPLSGMSMTSLTVEGCKVSDLSPVAQMPLDSLGVYATKVSDLRPIAGLRLTSLIVMTTPVTDLSPLRGMPIKSLSCLSTGVSDLSPLHDCPDLKTLDVKKTKVTAAQVAALQKALPNCKIEWDAVSSASPVSEGARPKTP